ncbi:uncharacterized protein LOC111879844 [Lactuca sativa]|uniref:Uncharacterized protein n=1 Tax=Lactuca sativa TaxID=4236 RepID=A0A9R1XQF8_LACSA|nr:uncharacterized protein LOC111879844 [Lactuca sativa]KAJ0223540.1 hypothetical protein LSAT_V11C200096280 [Lactuca sativa]
MVFSLNSFVGFTSTAKHQNVPRECIGLKASHFPSSSTSLVFSRRPIHTRNQRPLSVSNSDRVTTETTEKTSEIPEVSISINQSLPTSEVDPIKKTQPDEAASNGSISSPSESEPKRSKLTAREKLKAARVRSRSSEPKPVKKAEMGSKVLEALRENDRISGKMRSGLPEAPTNLFDDSKRGMPKKGLTFELPVGWDVFLIILSVVLISTIMFTTTFIVWKVGAIHFNEN